MSRRLSAQGWAGHPSRSRRLLSPCSFARMPPRDRIDDATRWASRTARFTSLAPLRRRTARGSSVHRTRLWPRPFPSEMVDRFPEAPIWAYTGLASPTSVTYSIDSSSISCPHIIRPPLLEVYSFDLTHLLGTENLQPRRLGSHMLFPPRWFSLHLGTGSLPSISSGLLQPLGKTARGTGLRAASSSRRTSRSTSAALHFNSSRPARLPPTFKANAPCPNKSWHAGQGNLGFAHDHGHGSAHQSHIFHDTFICSEKHSLSHLIR